MSTLTPSRICFGAVVVEMLPYGATILLVWTAPRVAWYLPRLSFGR